jgi:hypothetical protein
MHYLGMTALIVPGTLSWTPSLVASSLFLGIGFSTAAVVTFYRYKEEVRATASAAALLTLAICGLHFFAMGAVTIQPDPTIAVAPSGIDRPLLAMLIAGVTFIVLLSALAGAEIHKANIRCELSLRDQNARFEGALQYFPIGMSMFHKITRLALTWGQKTLGNRF